MNLIWLWCKTIIMRYFNYHAKIKRLINAGQLIRYEFIKNYNGISPALVLYFKDFRPMPIREHRWQEYFDILNIKTFPKNF